MNNKKLEVTNKLNNQWFDSDFYSYISNSDKLNIPMPSMSCNPNMYMPNMPNIINVNSDDNLQETREQKYFSNKK